MSKITRSELVSIAKMCFLVILATVSFNVSAGSLYVGTPTRPNTIWVPSHCNYHGRFIRGHYLLFMRTPVTTRDIKWVDGKYDRCCNYVGAHWKLRYHHWCHHHYRCHCMHRHHCFHKFHHHHHHHHHHWMQ